MATEAETPTGEHSIGEVGMASNANNGRANATTRRTYGLVFAGLVFLTILTVSVSFIHLGEWHLPVGIAFAAAKAILIVAFFMHLTSSPRLIWLVVGAALFWLGLLLVLTMADYATRAGVL